MSILGLHTLVEDRSQCYREHEIHVFKETSWFQSLFLGKFYEFHIKNRIETTKKIILKCFRKAQDQAYICAFITGLTDLYSPAKEMESTLSLSSSLSFCKSGCSRGSNSAQRS